MAQGVHVTFDMNNDDRLYITMPMYHSAAGILGLYFIFCNLSFSHLGIGQVFTAGCSAVIRRKFSASNFWADCVKYKCTVILIFVVVSFTCFFYISGNAVYRRSV
jgi:solute carrier family 27 fatty acid transporter 1/4